MQHVAHGYFKPDKIKYRMARWWADNHRGNIIAENKFLMIRAVKQKVKMVLGMGNHYASEIFIGKPSYAFQPVMQQQTGINNNVHKLTALAGKWLLFTGLKDY
jgi:hypothetical protein